MTNHLTSPASTTDDLGDLFEAVTGTTSVIEHQLPEDCRSHEAATADEIALSTYIADFSDADEMADTIEDFSHIAPELQWL